MNLIDKIRAINAGTIFNDNATDAILFENAVIKDGDYVGLQNNKLNYFYTRYDNKPISLIKVKQTTSCEHTYEVVESKVMVMQFKDFDTNGIMLAILNIFKEDFEDVIYEVSQVEIRKDFILKSEIGELKPFDTHNLLAFYYTERKILDNCGQITCNGEPIEQLSFNVNVYFNSILRYTPSCGSDLELNLIDTLGGPITATFDGLDIIIDTASCDDATYSVRYENGDIIQNGTIPSGGSEIIEVPNVLTGLIPMQTGQVVSYRDGDDGFSERGRSILDRFQDTLGVQDYTNGIIIDKSTFNGTNVLGFYYVNAAFNWNDAIDNATTLNIDGFNGWEVANRNEALSLANNGLFNILDYAPFNIVATIWTSTSYYRDSNQAFTLAAAGSSTPASKIAQNRYLAVRIFNKNEIII